MRFLLLIFIVAIVLLVFCESKPAKKSSKSKHHLAKKSTKPAKSDHSKTSVKNHNSKSSKKSKVGEKKAKITKPKAEKTPPRNHKDKSIAKDTTTKSKSPANSKARHETKSEKKSKLESSIKKANLRTIPKNCDEIVQQYADGQLVMYEYKIKMAKCLKAEKSKKKSKVPSSDLVNPQPSVDSSVPQQQAASYYPSQDISNLDQPQAPAQTNAAFSQNPMYNQAAPASAQQNYNYYARSNIPAAPQAQDASQQWNAANVVPAQPQVDANTRKDILPAAPNNNDAFAQFMNIQSSQDTASQPIQQRSDIPSDQPYDAMMANQQAYFRQQYRYWSPEDHGLFPENP